MTDDVPRARNFHAMLEVDRWTRGGRLARTLWDVTEQTLDALAIGAGILGTGGGGNPYLGKLEAREQLRAGKEIQIVSLDELPVDAFTTTVGGMGSPTVGIERIDRGNEALRAMRALERHLGRSSPT